MPTGAALIVMWAVLIVWMPLYAYNVKPMRVTFFTIMDPACPAPLLSPPVTSAPQTWIVKLVSQGSTYLLLSTAHRALISCYAKTATILPTALIAKSVPILTQPMGPA